MPVGEATPVADERFAGAGRTEEPGDTSVPVRAVRRAVFPFWNWAIAIVGQRDPEGGEFGWDWWTGEGTPSNRLDGLRYSGALTSDEGRPGNASRWSAGPGAGRRGSRV